MINLRFKFLDAPGGQKAPPATRNHRRPGSLGGIFFFIGGEKGIQEECNENSDRKIQP